LGLPTPALFDGHVELWACLPIVANGCQSSAKFSTERLGICNPIQVWPELEIGLVRFLARIAGLDRAKVFDPSQQHLVCGVLILRL
jgi:hypothetical protein